jgi:hypothetical protein
MLKRDSGITGVPSTRPLLTPYFSLLFEQFRQSALVSRGGVGMDLPLATGPVEQLDGLSVRGRRVLPGGAAHLLDGRAEFAPLSAVLRGASASLAHALLGGFDFRQNDLGATMVTFPTVVRNESGET